ncbi:MAG: phosphate ABC transporter substrate-binding protein PstS family protein [Desulfamplus sp.]|nr:phosphate ABC transporter substrate-binding protein PstS family protein [Desulfamplus sp.]
MSYQILKNIFIIRLLIVGVLFQFMQTSLYAGETLRIQGSNTLYPIAVEAAAAFMDIHEDIVISIEGTGSGHGIKALIDGSTDIANASRFMKEKELQMAYEKGNIPIPFRIAYDCIIPITHKSNPIHDITMANIQGVYAGKITNWKELGGEDAPISVVSRDRSSGTFGVWQSIVMGNEDMTPAAKLKPSNAEILEAVKDNPNAIGYIGIGYLTQSIKPLAVNGVFGGERTTLDGTYPISRPLFMFTPGWPKGITKKFIDFMLEPSQGQQQVRKAGFISLYLPIQSPHTPCPETNCKPCPEIKSKPCPPCPPSPECPPCPESTDQEVSILAQPNPLSRAQTEPSPGIEPGSYPKIESGPSSPRQKTSHDTFLKMSQPERTLLIQQHLNRLGYNVGRADGIWGPRTLKGYTRFQVKNGIKPIYSIIAYPVIELLEQK